GGTSSDFKSPWSPQRVGENLQGQANDKLNLSSSFWRRQSDLPRGYTAWQAERRSRFDQEARRPPARQARALPYRPRSSAGLDYNFALDRQQATLVQTSSHHQAPPTDFSRRQVAYNLARPNCARFSGEQSRHQGGHPNTLERQQIRRFS